MIFQIPVKWCVNTQNLWHLPEFDKSEKIENYLSENIKKWNCLFFIFFSKFSTTQYNQFVIYKHFFAITTENQLKAPNLLVISKKFTFQKEKKMEAVFNFLVSEK